MNNNYHIRSLVESDLEQVFKVRTQTTENAISMEKLTAYGITIDSIAAALRTDVKGWVCESNTQIIGFCMGNKATAEMQVLAVLPAHEGYGIAKKLMLKVEHWLFKHGHQTIWLLTTPDSTLRAYGFYQYIGWEATGEIIDKEEKFILSKPQFDQEPQ